MRRICHYRNKLSPNKTIVIHRSFIRSKLEQGCTFIRNSRKGLLKGLNTIENQLLRKVDCTKLSLRTGCTKTMPIPTLMAIAAEVPLHIRADYLASNEIIKEIKFINSC